MFEEQFKSPEKFDIQLLKKGTSARCHYCSIRFKSNGSLYTSGARVIYLDNKNVVTKVACPICCSTLFRFTETFSVQEELELSMPIYLSAISLYDSNYHNHSSITLTAYKIAVLTKLSESYFNAVDLTRNKMISLNPENLNKIKKSRYQYNNWITSLASSVFETPQSDKSIKELLHSNKQYKLGQSIKLRLISDGDFIIDKYAVYPTIEYILYLTNPQIAVFELDELVKASKLYSKDPILEINN